MAQVPFSNSSTLPSTGVTSGHLPYNGNGAHMRPQPLSIPQSAGAPVAADALNTTLSPGPAPTPGAVRRAAPEPNKKALYVGALDSRVTEENLHKIFEIHGEVKSVKIIPDKNAKGFNYGFVEFDDPICALAAMETLEGRDVYGTNIKVHWAYQPSNVAKEDTSAHHHLFVGDLSNDVSDLVLLEAFSNFGTVSEARVMWDMKTGRSRGYGFVAFPNRAEAERAVEVMNGEFLGQRFIRCNWANQKGQPTLPDQMQAMPGIPPTVAPVPYGGHHQFPTAGSQSYEMVAAQTPQWQTTCYVGNLTAYTTDKDLLPLFLKYGYVQETRFQSDRGYAFVKMDSHDNATAAICELNGHMVNGRPLKCSWGKDRPPAQNFAFSPAAGGPQQGFVPHTPGGYGGFPQYGGPPVMPHAGPSSVQQYGGYQQVYGGQNPGAFQRGPMPGGMYMQHPPQAAMQNQQQHAGQYPGYNGYQG